MAAACALSKDQFLCSICLDVFTEPITLPCGHNFCRRCIDRRWPIDAKCMCPRCKKLFFLRPELKVNTFIAKMAAHFTQAEYSATRRSEKRAAKPGDVLCDMCTPPRESALRSCLVCLSSFCESHLEPHLNMPGLRRHQLTEPRGNLEERVCVTHHKPLELFCCGERVCVCVLCVHAEHRGHDVITLQEATQQQRTRLRRDEEHVQDHISSRMRKIAELRGSLRVSHAAADRQMSDGVKVFTALMESVQKALTHFVTEMNKKKSDTEEQVEGLVQELEQEICELKKRRAELQKHAGDSLRSEDALHLLQNSSHLSRDDQEPTRDWTSVGVRGPTHGGAVVRALRRLEQDFHEKTRALHQAELKRVQRMKVDVAMDTESADQRILHSHSKTGSLSEGFYFEAEVGGKCEWTLGVAEHSPTLSPHNGFWTIGLKDGAHYVSENPKVSVFTKRQPERVGVFVDYKEGVVSFYDADAPALLHSFTDVTFTQKLRPFCAPGLLSPGGCGCQKDSSKDVLLDDLVDKLQRHFYTERKHLDSQNDSLFEGILNEFRKMMRETDRK